MNMTVTIHKSNNEFPYISVSYAMRNLGGDAFKLYTYLSSLGDNEEIEISPARIAAEIGCSRTNVYRALEQLQRENFCLRRKMEQKLDFYTEPNQNVENSYILE